MKLKLFFLLALTIGFASCGPTIYKSADFSTITEKHKTVAILPTVVDMELRPREMKNITPKQFAEMKEATGEEIQLNMYAWFLQRSKKFKYTVTFQDISKTNEILANAGLTYATLKNKGKDGLARLLGVDAVISSRVTMRKPVSEGAALAVGVLIGSWETTNSVQASISINEGQNGELIWKYDYSNSGSVGSNTPSLVNALMKKASKKFPYNSK